MAMIRIGFRWNRLQRTNNKIIYIKLFCYFYVTQVIDVLIIYRYRFMLLFYLSQLQLCVRHIDNSLRKIVTTRE